MRDRPDAKGIQHVRLTELAALKELASRALTGLEDMPSMSAPWTGPGTIDQHLATWVEVPLRQIVQLVEAYQSRIKPEEAGDEPTE